MNCVIIKMITRMITEMIKIIKISLILGVVAIVEHLEMHAGLFEFV